jgi:hypothetical protein
MGQRGPLWPAWDPIKEPTLQAHAVDFIKKILAIKVITKEAEIVPPYKLFYQIIVAAIVLA